MMGHRRKKAGSDAVPTRDRLTGCLGRPSSKGRSVMNTFGRRGSFGRLVTRRTVLQGGIGGLAVVSGLGGAPSGLAQDATPAPNLPRFDGETLRIFTFAGNPFIEGPVKAHAPEFDALTGGKVE